MRRFVIHSLNYDSPPPTRTRSDQRPRIPWHAPTLRDLRRTHGAMRRRCHLHRGRRRPALSGMLEENAGIHSGERQGSGAAGTGLRINQQGSSRRCQHQLVSLFELWTTSYTTTNPQRKPLANNTWQQCTTYNPNWECGRKTTTHAARHELTLDTATKAERS